MSIVEYLSQPFWQRLGLTLVHFLWQGLAVAVLAGAFVKMFRLKHGNARYGAYLVAFIAMIACPVVTFTAIDIPISPDTGLMAGAESAEVIESSPYTALPTDDILPEVAISSPAIPASADSIPLGQRISRWLNVSMPWILVIWMAGVAVLSVRLLMGFVGVYRWRHHLEALPERIAQRIVSLSEGLGMRRFSRVFISPTVLQAMAVGYLRPIVLLPAAMLTQMQPEMLEAVIAHELAHIRRFDLWINLIQRITETLLFYHPAVWWLSNCIRSERELCCDDLAVKATGERITYASTLESVGRARFMTKQPVLATGLGQGKKPTLGRVRHILGLRPTQRNCPFWLAGVITVLFLAALVIPTTLALTNQSDEELNNHSDAQRIKALLIKPEIVTASDGRAKLSYFSKYVHCRDLAKLVAEKNGFITDKDITCDEGKNQISIVCPTTGDAETVVKFLQEVDVEPIQVQVDVHVVEAYSDVELDLETRESVRNITSTKTTSNAKPGKSLSVPDILREYVKTEPQPENSIEKLVDLLTSRGYLKILMNPTLEVVNGKTAKVQSSYRDPTGKEINDSFEVTPQILDDGNIDVATKMVFENKQIGDPRTHINIKDSGSLVIGSVTKTEKRDIVRDGVKGSEERTTEVLVILTLTIITPEMNLSKKADVQVEREGATLEEFRKKAWKVFGFPPGVMDYLDSCVMIREEMNPEKLITVHCVDKEGKGISYCRVVFVDRGEQIRLIDYVATDEKGYAYCDDIDGPFSIMAQVFDYSPLTKAWRFQHKKIEKLYNANDKPLITVQFAPFPEGISKIQGNIKDQYNHPLKEFDLVLTQREGQNEGWGDCFTKQIKKHFIHPEGNFEMGNLTAGTYTYFVYPKEQSAYVWDFNMGEITVGAEGTVQLNIEIEAKRPAVQVEGTGITAEKESEFSAILPNGVTVELIGMCEYPSVGKQWWRPDGSLLVNPPYDESDIDILSVRKPDAIPIEFAFRLSGNLGEPAWEAKVKGDEQAFVWWTGRRAKDGEFLTDIKSIGMFVKSDQRTLDLRLGFSFADGLYEWVDFKNISVKPNFKPDLDVEVEGAWGEALEGVQMRVRAERQRWYEGETPKFLVDMRNKGTVEWELGLTQENWEVELDGVWHRVGASFTGVFPTLLFGPVQEHKDIEFYPGVWSDWNINGRPLKFTPGLHTVRLSFGPSTRDHAYWRRLRVVSNPVLIEILPADADKRGWGEAVAGMQCGLRADKRLWKADETPKLQAVARNVGLRPWRLPRPSELFYLKVGSKIWLWKGTLSDRPADLKPGEALEKTTILLSEDWVGAYGSDLRLKLSPGKHTVQLVMFVSDPIPPEAVPGTIPVPRQLRIESNVVAIEVLPTGERPGTVEDEGDAATALQAELHELWRQRDQGLAGVEAFGKKLLEKYTKREEKPLIYYQLAEIYAQSGQADPNKIVEFARQGWWFLNDPVKKARLFVYWGDALQLTKGREEAARIYLRGLQFCMQYGLPQEKPELPTVSINTVDGPAEEVENYDKEDKRQMDARKHAKLIGELIEHRQVLTGRIVQLYAPLPDAFDELHELVMRYLGSEQASQQIIAAAKSYRIDHETAMPVIMRLGGDPNPRADLDWGEETKGIRVRLRADTNSWGVGEVPKFKLDVRNDGSHILMLNSAPDCWGIEVDGVWHRITIPMLGGAKGMSFGPDKRWYNLEVSLDMAVGSQNENGGFELSPGRHTVRAVLARGLSEDGKMLSVGAVSNPVKIVILPTGSDETRSSG